MIKVGLLGSPGCGKTTLAAYAFAMLKDQGIDGELINEYIREYMNRHKRIPNITFQSVIYERQLEKEKIVPPGLDFLITDSPHILSYIYTSLYIDYNDKDQIELLGHLYLKFLRQSREAYDLIYLLEENHPPNMNDGVRYQTKEEMNLLKVIIPAFLDMHHIKYTLLSADIPTKQRAHMVVDDVKKLIFDRKCKII